MLTMLDIRPQSYTMTMRDDAAPMLCQDDSGVEGV